MKLKPTVALLALAMTAAAAAQATTILTVNANYDAFGSTENTSFTITNTSGFAESNIDLLAGSDSVVVQNLAAGQSLTYQFNEPKGAFTDEPGDKGVLDTTNYQVSFLYQGSAVSTELFSPVANLTGGYVDFLGACLLDRDGCSVDPNGIYPFSGEVAQAMAPVPLPPALLLLASGLFGLRNRLFRGAGK
jgi:hypothetical protein